MKHIVISEEHLERLIRSYLSLTSQLVITATYKQHLAFGEDVGTEGFTASCESRAEEIREFIFNSYGVKDLTEYENCILEMKVGFEDLLRETDNPNKADDFTFVKRANKLLKL